MKTGVVAPGRVEGLLHEATSPSLEGRYPRRPTGGYNTRLVDTTRRQLKRLVERARSRMLGNRELAHFRVEAADGGIDQLGRGSSITHLTHPCFCWLSSWFSLFTRPFGQTVDKRHVRKREVPGNERGSCRARCGTADATTRGSWYARFLSRSMLMFFHVTIYSMRSLRTSGEVPGVFEVPLVPLGVGRKAAQGPD